MHNQLNGLDRMNDIFLNELLSRLPDPYCVECQHPLMDEDEQCSQCKQVEGYEGNPLNIINEKRFIDD